MRGRPGVERGAERRQRRLVGEGDIERAPVDRPELGSVSPIASTALAYSSDRVMSETVVSSVLSVTGTPSRCSRASGCAATHGTIPACQFEVGQRSRVHAARRQLGAEGGVVDGARSVGDPLRIHRERAPDLRRAAPLAGVEGDPQAARPCGLEGAARGAAGPGRRPRARRGPSRSAPGRGTGPRSRRARRSRPGRASAAPCR